MKHVPRCLNEARVYLRTVADETIELTKHVAIIFYATQEPRLKGDKPPVGPKQVLTTTMGSLIFSWTPGAVVQLDSGICKGRAEMGLP